MNPWIAAWLFSLISSAGVYFFAHKAKIPRADSFMVAAATFSSPLFQAISSTNSFIYSIDFITPVAIYYAWRSWSVSHRTLRRAATALLFAGGLVPLVIAVLFSRNPMDLQFNGINAYRLVGAMALMVRLSALPRRHAAINWLCAFSWIALTVAAAMMAKLLFGIDSDVYSHGYGLSTSLETGNEGAFFVMGMFRSAIGMFGIFAVSAYYCAATGAPRSSFRLIPLLGAIAGLVIAVLAGSKTSLTIIAIVLAASLVTIGVRSVASTAVLALVAGFVVWNADTAQLRHFIPQSVLRFYDSAGEDRLAFDFREQRWRDCADSVLRSPLILVGVAPPDSMPVDPDGASPYSLGYYHNEYVSVSMLGGAWSFIPYLIGLGLLASLMLSRRSGSPAERFGLIAFAGGIMQAFTGPHLQPGLLFGATVSATAAIYGFSCSRLQHSNSPAQLVLLQRSLGYAPSRPPCPHR